MFGIMTGGELLGYSGCTTGTHGRVFLHGYCAWMCDCYWHRMGGPVFWSCAICHE